jgi:hypothetical protein
LFFSPADVATVFEHSANYPLSQFLLFTVWQRAFIQIVKGVWMHTGVLPPTSFA